MGAWGAGAFQNDEASDFVDEVIASDGLGLIDAALQKALSAGANYLEYPEGSSALAATEIVAGLHGKPSQESVPDGLAEWISQQSSPVSPDLMNKARSAVERVVHEPSELLELWSEGDLSEWLAATKDLLSRLS